MAYYRLKNILSQQETAKILGISQSYYARLENNPVIMSVEMALKIKSILNAPSIEELLEAM